MKNRKNKSLKNCPGCNGVGQVCCMTWTACQVDGLTSEDLKFSGVGLPLWPLNEYWEMNFCPFCGRRFEPDTKKVK